VGAGVGSAAQFLGAGKFVAAAASGLGSSVANASINGGFSWRQVAANVVGNAIGSSVGGAIGGALGKGATTAAGQFAAGLTSKFVGGMVSMHARRALGSDEGVNYGNVAADAFANTLVDRWTGVHAAGAANARRVRGGADELINWRPSGGESDGTITDPFAGYGRPGGLFGGAWLDAPEGGWITGPRTHTVRSGDTLSDILGTSNPSAIGRVMALNGLKNSTIRPGQQLVLDGDLPYTAESIQAYGQAALNADNARLAAISAQQAATAANAGNGQRATMAMLDWLKAANGLQSAIREHFEIDINEEMAYRAATHVDGKPIPGSRAATYVDRVLEARRAASEATLNGLTAGRFEERVARSLHDAAPFFAADIVAARALAYGGKLLLRARGTEAMLRAEVRAGMSMDRSVAQAGLARSSVALEFDPIAAQRIASTQGAIRTPVVAKTPYGTTLADEVAALQRIGAQRHVSLDDGGITQLAQRFRFNEHIFDAELNGTKVVGFHYEPTAMNSRIVPGTRNSPDAFGVYRGKVEFEASPENWIQKSGGSTFFPDTWSRTDVMYESIQAFRARSYPDPMKPTKWSGTTPSGVLVRGYDYPNLTVYPVWRP
jgi:hypothetical protein